jgi:hypothetical protein
MINLYDKKTFEKLEITSEVRTEIIQNKKIDLPVYLIPLKLLKYNKNNGRIFVGFKEYQVENDLSKVNEEEIESKIEEIIWSNNKDSNKETLESIKKFGQLVVGVVLQDGTVLDGNRRFTALRKLSREKSNQDNNQYFKAIIIKTVGEGAFSTRDIRKMELSIQYGQQTKLDYDPIDFAFSIHSDINDKEKNLTVEDLTEVLNKSTKEIQEIVSNADNIIEYLKYYKQVGKTHLAKELSLYYPILELTKFLNKNDFSVVEKNKRRRIFFDVFTAVKHKTPQQSLRTELIDMIFKDDSEFTRFSEQFGNLVESDFKTSLSLNKDNFDTFYKNYKESDTCNTLSDWYKDYLESIRLKNETDSIPKTIQRAIDLISKIDVDAFKQVENTSSKKILKDIDEKLKELEKITVRLIKKING